MLSRKDFRQSRHLVSVIVDVLKGVEGLLGLLLPVVEEDQKVVYVFDHDGELLLKQRGLLVNQSPPRTKTI